MASAINYSDTTIQKLLEVFDLYQSPPNSPKHSLLQIFNNSVSQSEQLKANADLVFPQTLPSDVVLDLYPHFLEVFTTGRLEKGKLEQLRKSKGSYEGINSNEYHIAVNVVPTEEGDLYHLRKIYYNQLVQDIQDMNRYLLELTTAIDTAKKIMGEINIAALNKGLPFVNISRETNAEVLNKIKEGNGNLALLSGFCERFSAIRDTLKKNLQTIKGHCFLRAEQQHEQHQKSRDQISTRHDGQVSGLVQGVLQRCAVVTETVYNKMARHLNPYESDVWDIPSPVPTWLHEQLLKKE